MKSVVIILAISLGVVLYIFLRFIFQRICFIFALHNFAKKYNYYVSKIPYSYLLPLNSSNSSIVLKTDSSVYDIKLFGLFLKHCEIHFWSAREYSVEWYFSRRGLVGEPLIGETNAKPRRSLGNFDDTACLDPSSQRERIPVLLITPANAPVRTTQRHANKVVRLHAGDKIGGFLFADRDYLFRYIAHREQKDF